MCRMLLTIGKSTDLSPYLDFLYEMSNNGKHSPHNDGYGYALYRNEEVVVKKTINPIGEEHNISGTALIAHSRKLTSSKKTIINTQPFVSADISFAHNGNIKGLRSRGKSDSYGFYQMIKKGFSDGITNAREKNFDSLNFLITDGKYAAAYREARKDMGYFSLFYKLEDGRFTVSTEEMEGKWYEIENKKLVVFRSGRVSEYDIGEVVPSVI